MAGLPGRVLHGKEPFENQRDIANICPEGTQSYHRRSRIKSQPISDWLAPNSAFLTDDDSEMDTLN